PAVSRQLSALEESLGVILLLRTTRCITVTKEGRLYYEHCLRVLREVEVAKESIHEANIGRGLLTVTAPVTFGLARIKPDLPGFLSQPPTLSVDLRLEDRVVDLIADGIDIAIRVGSESPKSSSLIAHTLLRYRRVVVASPGYL